MAKPPAQSRLVRGKTVAFAEAKEDKKKKADDKKPADDKPADDKLDAKAEDAKADDAKADDAKADDAKADDAKTDAKTDDAKADEAKAEAPAGEPERPVVMVSTPRAHTETMAMPSHPVGKPPELPTTAPPPAPVATGAVESPTNLPVPKNVPAGNPDDPAPAPGLVPPGDSRSLRNGNEFSLVYRMGTFVISRAGTVGKRGVWRVVEYPTSSAASHGYAKECSRFISEGFSDYRG
jgi:hypothetical protein